VRVADGAANVEVGDDGVGGADASARSGLRGLADRVNALGGKLETDSLPRAGTTVRARIPVAGSDALNPPEPAGRTACDAVRLLTGVVTGARISAPRG
jgi:signal transduction histidine kinase